MRKNIVWSGRAASGALAEISANKPKEGKPQTYRLAVNIRKRGFFMVAKVIAGTREQCETALQKY